MGEPTTEDDVLRRLTWPNEVNRRHQVAPSAFKGGREDRDSGLSVNRCVPDIIGEDAFSAFCEALLPSERGMFGVCALPEPHLPPAVECFPDPVENEPFGESHALIRTLSSTEDYGRLPDPTVRLVLAKIANDRGLLIAPVTDANEKSVP